ncbi:hypothetical protein [Pontibacter sp. SGAir0037]|uniref:hypothetical protein n=1 Tax=Pontibacter sp. SGAir0037 TaxID=2571030 RepID=UPI0010CCF328|nr:hypothetical protein [Pontibacter sp. SGAir0037]QCR23076.1 hypothetical protein C1N53_12460 [Pontibacter sp. SGAir0037]
MSTVVSEDLTVAYSQFTVLKTTALSGGTAMLPKVGAKPTTPAEKQMGGGEIALWGENNLFPVEVMKDVESDAVLASGLRKITDMWYGGGLVYGLVSGFNEDGTEKFERTSIPEVEAFLNRSRRYGYEALQDLAYFVNAFPEFILTKDRSKIWSICEQEAYHSRYSKPDTNGNLNHLYINANWADGGTAENSTKVPVIDPYFDTAETIKARNDGYKYIYPISVPSPGKTVYQLASWNAIRRTGWLEVAKAIPQFKKKLFENQLSIKYIIEIHSLYWNWKYGDWDAKPKEERTQIIKQEVEDFNKIMTGPDGAGKSILSLTFMHGGQEFNAYKVTAIDDKLKTGLYVEDSQEAASHIMTALGLPTSLYGASPGKGMGAGSGSDARVAFNNFISTSKFVQDLVLEPLHFVRDYNGWPENLRFRFLNPLIMTLDKGKQSDQEAS